MTPRRIFGVEKNYDWGDETVIRSSLGESPTSGTKVAELWCGTHPQGPSHLDSPNGPLLRDVSGDMNMLVKLLSCQQPLSLQTHPTVSQAREGFAREEAHGISRDAPERMYRDKSDKPEMIVALSRFEALCGFASVEKSIDLLSSIGWELAARKLNDGGVPSYLEWAFQQTSIPALSDAPEWLSNLVRLYPTDNALFIAPLLNYVVLNEGDALSLPAGNLHAYLHGFGLEVMNSSDNVIRAGFTSKHVDVHELLQIVDTSPLPEPIERLNDNDEFTSPSPAFSIGHISTANRHIDNHRIVFGQFSNNPHHELFFVEAGTQIDVSGARGYVCVQN